MAIRSGNIFYFPFKPTDQVLIDETKVAVEDAPYAAAPNGIDPYPQSLKLRFISKMQPRQPQRYARSRRDELRLLPTRAGQHPNPTTSREPTMGTGQPPGQS
jgi:hypothetical protein